MDKVAREGRLEIAPLRNLPVVKDLVTDMREFFDKWAQAQGNFQGSRTRNDAFQEIRPESEQRKRIDAAIECIGCGVCYAACDVVSLNPDYLGPAALNRAWTLLQDERVGARGLTWIATEGQTSLRATSPVSDTKPETESISGVRSASSRGVIAQWIAHTAKAWPWRTLTATAMPMS